MSCFTKNGTDPTNDGEVSDLLALRLLSAQRLDRASNTAPRSFEEAARQVSAFVGERKG